jgi:hypothetical protein
MELPKGNSVLTPLPNAEPTRPKTPGVAELQACKDRYGFSWYWKKELPESKAVNEHRYFNLICGICQSFHWVSWDSLKTGTSKCCASCAKLPTEERINEIIEKYKPMWRPIYPYAWKSSSDDRRMFYMQCQCGKKKFVRWAKFSQGQSLGCQSCMSKLKKHGLSTDPIYLTWRYLKSEGHELCPSWRTFEGFRKWAAEFYHPDFKIIRWDKNLPFSPENCDYVPKNRKAIEVDGIVSLPTGNIKIPRRKKSRERDQTVSAGNQKPGHDSVT